MRDDIREIPIPKSLRNPSPFGMGWEKRERPLEI
jgi:hypothetical protein